jgi:hypothetical protein
MTISFRTSSVLLHQTACLASSVLTVRARLLCIYTGQGPPSRAVACSHCRERSPAYHDPGTDQHPDTRTETRQKLRIRLRVEPLKRKMTLRLSTPKDKSIEQAAESATEEVCFGETTTPAQKGDQLQDDEFIHIGLTSIHRAAYVLDKRHCASL